eukprot:4373939-Pyramimonas_sp.AAC.1
MPQAAPCVTQGRLRRSQPQAYCEMRMFVSAIPSIGLPVHTDPKWLDNWHSCSCAFECHLPDLHQ